MSIASFGRRRFHYHVHAWGVRCLRPTATAVNEDNFDEYVWRGAAAAAERLWSPYALTPSHTLATDRFVEHLCRLSLLGVRAGPIQPSFCPADSLPAPNATVAAGIVAAIDAVSGAKGDLISLQLTAEQAAFVRSRLL